MYAFPLLVCVLLADMMMMTASAPRSEEAAHAGRGEIRVRGSGAPELDQAAFHDFVLEEGGNIVATNWFLYLCSDSEARCGLLLPSYEALGRKLEDQLNGIVEETPIGQTASVRFAKVDCFAELELCGELGVSDYPTIVHYREQVRISDWTSVRKSQGQGLYPWLQEELGLRGSRNLRAGRRTAPLAELSAPPDATCGFIAIASRAVAAAAAAASGSAADDSPVSFTDMTPAGVPRGPDIGAREALCLAVLVIALLATIVRLGRAGWLLLNAASSELKARCSQQKAHPPQTVWDFTEESSTPAVGSGYVRTQLQLPRISSTSTRLGGTALRQTIML